MTESTRHEQMNAFLTRCGWETAKLQALTGDASSRRYFRLVKNGEQAMLMDQPRSVEMAACPPNANEQERRQLGYNAMARLAGPDCRPFAALSHFLRDKGFSAPQVYSHDYASGFLLLEDLGDGRFADLMLAGAEEEPYYEAAVDALARLHAWTAPRLFLVPGADSYTLQSYDALAMETEVLLLPDWFYPAASGRKLAADALDDYVKAWRKALAQLDVTRPVVVLRDFHAENLMWLGQREGIGKVGLLDFQDALAGDPAYDVISLVEDARRDVSVELAQSMMERYMAARCREDIQFDRQAFQFSAALLAAQRNTKIVGIFARLWKRDGKPRYTQLLPRMWRYLDRDLAHPALSELEAWFDRHIPDSWRGTLGQ